MANFVWTHTGTRCVATRASIRSSPRLRQSRAASLGLPQRLLSSARVTVLSGLLRVNAQDTTVEFKPDLPLEIAHLLLIDVVVYSKLLVNEQIELLQELNQIVRNTDSFRAAETSGKLNRM